MSLWHWEKGITSSYFCSTLDLQEIFLDPFFFIAFYNFLKLIIACLCCYVIGSLLLCYLFGIISFSMFNYAGVEMILYHKNLLYLFEPWEQITSITTMGW